MEQEEEGPEWNQARVRDIALRMRGAQLRPLAPPTRFWACPLPPASPASKSFMLRFGIPPGCSLMPPDSITAEWFKGPWKNTGVK
ncbi:hypothetical protein SKAU_G00387700 [Synaphobranchus kaupii]|uniref:Uncharacterized protein n=1 Tax=Synaphobranchus kaupii TaxID=118154 RepID=A0A9Q1IBA9_SYNKA|nr:hypothetical protein SKAU_G00387700 [Synaphobranchus kaupii]